MPSAALATTGSVLTATEYNYLPRGYIIASTKTSDQGSITTAVDVTGLSVSVPMVSGRLYKTTVQLEIFSSVANDVYLVELTDSTPTTLQRSTGVLATGATTFHLVFYETAGSTATVTRKIRASRGSGTGNLTVTASGGRAALILVEDMGVA